MVHVTLILKKHQSQESFECDLDRRLANHLANVTQDFVCVRAWLQHSHQRVPNSFVGEWRWENRLGARQRHLVGIKFQRRHAFDEAVAAGVPRQDIAAAAITGRRRRYMYVQGARVAVDVFKRNSTDQHCFTFHVCVVATIILCLCRRRHRCSVDLDAFEHRASCQVGFGTATHRAANNGHLDRSMLLDDLGHGPHEYGGVLWMPA